MKFDFATAGRILFGCGSSEQLPTLAQGLGSMALLVLGRSRRRGEVLTARLATAGVRSLIFTVDGEPTTHLVDEAAALARTRACDLVIAVGGGSVIDTGKAVAAMLTHPGAVLDYLELVGGGKPLVRHCVPCIAVPTTAGTGTEVTRNAVLGVPEHQVKASLRSHHLLPRLAVIDPELCCSLPPEVTAYTGMDALTQLIEPFVSTAANPLTDGVCREGLLLAGRSLAAAFHDGSDLAARQDMCAAALFSGMALANAKLGAVHGLAGVLGGATGHPHGAICARLLPFVMEANIQALQDGRDGAATLPRYAEVARILTGNPSARSQDGVEWVQSLCTELKIPPLRDAGLTVAECSRIIPTAQRASSMQGNPVRLSDEELLGILENAI
jgi:alcohol dehydrogenase class IV